MTVHTYELADDLSAFVTSYPVDGFELEICRWEEGDWEPIEPQKRMIGYTLWEAVTTVLTRNGYDWDTAQQLAAQGGIEYASSDED